MFSFFDSQFISNVESPIILGALKFVGIGFYLSLPLLWGFLQALVWLAERYSRLISGVQWWRSGILAAAGIMIHIIAWQIPGMFSDAKTDNVTASLTWSLALGGFVAWILCSRLYQFEFLHRLIVAVGVPIFVFCAIALGLVIQLKMTGY